MSDQETTTTAENQQQQTQTASEQKFSQADVDRMIAERLKRQEESLTKKLAEKLGVESLDTAAAALKTAKEREDAELTEIERLKKQLEDKTNKEKAYVEQITLMQRQRLIDARDTAVKSALTTARATNADRVFTLLTAEKADALGKVMNESGEIDKKAVEQLVKDAQKEYAEYFRSPSPGSPSNANGRVPEPNDAAAREANFRRMRRGY